MAFAIPQGISSQAVRSIPKDWDAEWFRRWVRDYLQNVDIRNTNAAGGVVITGIVTAPGTVSINGVSLNNIAPIPSPTIVGNNSGITAHPAALTPAQVVAMLPAFTASANGVVLASGGGTANWLRADGAWVPPAGGITGLAIPSGRVRLAASAGTAVTAIRSDADIQLDVTISPTWTGNHTYTPTTGVGVVVNGLNLGTTAGAQSEVQRFTVFDGNGDSLIVSNTRIFAGTDWTSAGSRIQQKIDVTWMGFIQFNNGSSGLPTNNGGISFGAGQSSSATGVAERMRIGQAGAVVINTPDAGQVGFTVFGVSGQPAIFVNGANAAGGPCITLQGNFTGAGNINLLALLDPNNTNGANFKIVGNGATTPSKTLRVQGGQFQITNDAYSATPLTLTDRGDLQINRLVVNTGFANEYCLDITGNGTVDQSLGVIIKAGTSQNDLAMVVKNQAATANYFQIAGDGSVIIGDATVASMPNTRGSGGILATKSSTSQWQAFFGRNSNNGVSSLVLLELANDTITKEMLLWNTSTTYTGTAFSGVTGPQCGIGTQAPTFYISSVVSGSARPAFTLDGTNGNITLGSTAVQPMVTALTTGFNITGNLNNTVSAVLRNTNAGNAAITLIDIDNSLSHDFTLGVTSDAFVGNWPGFTTGPTGGPQARIYTNFATPITIGANFKSAIGIDTTGRVNNPEQSQPAFNAVLITANQSVGAGVTADVIFNSAIFNQGTYYATGTGIFTAPVAGVYMISVQVIMVNTTAGSTTYKAIISKNNNTSGSGLVYGVSGTQVVAAGAVDGPRALTVAMQLAVNDTVRVKIVNSGANAIQVSTGETTEFSAILMW